jgi:N-dimethylarginine dimethylaminohydrolase
MIRSNNEWDSLKSVIVGTATNAHWPVNCPTFRKLEQTTGWKETPVPQGNVDQQIIDESNTDLQLFADILISLGIDVHRPTDLNFASFDGMYNYCPRDRVLIVDDIVIDAPMLFPTRKPEIKAIQHLLSDNIITCEDPNVFFDAANICRLGRDLLYLVSDSGNIEGALWLQDILGKEYNVHILNNIYSGVHIDSTISPIREGLVVVNGDRINESNLPNIFKSWDIIYIYGDQIVPQSFVNYPYASKYIALNFLTINPNLVICDPNQTILRNRLDSFGVETIGVELRHSRTLGGGHHCTTLDLTRK